ncbi:MAG: membrane protein insertase YidC [Candidatus Binataceae bacterium]
MDNSRVILAVGICLVLIFAYQELVLNRFFPTTPEPPERRAATEMVKPTNVPVPAVSVVAAAASAPAAAASSAAPAAAEVVAASSTPLVAAASAPPARTIEIDTDLYRAIFTTKGAQLTSFELKHYRQTAAANSPLYQMVTGPAGKRLPLAVVLMRGGKLYDDDELAYSTAAGNRIEVKNGAPTAAFTARAADGTTITKTLTFKAGSYLFGLKVAVSGGPADEEIGLAMSEPLKAHAGYYDIPQLQADVAGKVLVEAEKYLRKGVKPAGGPITYAGFGDRYFLSVFLPEKPAEGTLTMGYAGNQGIARLLFPGATQIETRVFAGPKLLDALDAAGPELHRAIDLGWTSILALLFLRALKLLHLVAPNYGWDIILVTVLVRLASLPMSIKGQRSAMKMAQLTPQIERLREKYKDNNEQLQKEMVDLYKRNHVNPLGGCLPMVIQLPIFIGLYEALLNSVELRHAPFIAWMNDLSAPECLPISWMPKLPYLPCTGLPVLVILMGATSFLQQWMMPKQPDPTQQRMMMFMPLMYVFFFLNFPAGLSLYYFASNILGIIQQFFLNREFQTIPA